MVISLRERGGQSSVEYVGLLLVIAVLFALGAYSGLGTWLGDRIACAIVGRCSDGGVLNDVYGNELAAVVERYAPSLQYAPGTQLLPTDYRECRSIICSAIPNGFRAVTNARSGSRITTFTRVIDRRARGGKLHIQYWFYYPETSRVNLGAELEQFYREFPQARNLELTLLTKGKAKAGKRLLLSEADDTRRRWKTAKADLSPVEMFSRWLKDHHRDSWQSYDVAIDGTGRVDQRTTEISSVLKTNRYRHCLSSECRKVDRGSQWWLTVGSGGHEMRVERHHQSGLRSTRDSDLRLVPLERLSPKELGAKFDQRPPWKRPVYRDPTDDGDHPLRKGEERNTAEKVYDELASRPTPVDDAKEAGRRTEEQLQRAKRHEVSEDYAACKVLLGDICDW